MCDVTLNGPLFGVNDGFYWLILLQLPTALYGQAVVLDKESDDFYTVGGTSGYNYYIDIHKINMRTKAWECVYKLRREEPLPHEPTPR